VAARSQTISASAFVFCQTYVDNGKITIGIIVMKPTLVFFKSHIKEHQAHSITGRMFTVKEHEDARHKKMKYGDQVNVEKYGYGRGTLGSTVRW